MKREVQKRKADLTTLRNPTLAGAQREDEIASWSTVTLRHRLTK